MNDKKYVVKKKKKKKAKSGKTICREFNMTPKKRKFWQNVKCQIHQRQKKRKNENEGKQCKIWLEFNLRDAEKTKILAGI